ncbi:glycogen synthesis protein GlgS [Enterobacter hormaechei]|nr:glycogen synthesis protein GlgS [Enterobacter hormaechei]NBG11892.1 glycogen synthesis protein GlgS [Enterobacter hormaechei]
MTLNSNHSDWRDMLMKRQDINALKNFDFLERSFARMYALGQPVDIDAVTGNMSNKQQAWFRELYDHYRKQAERARVIELR